ncbi:MAG: hypothetical protein IJ192_01295 [Clostridia bacterium]|nr:hypothetical protein [Clostridia bacterium]
MAKNVYKSDLRIFEETENENENIVSAVFIAMILLFPSISALIIADLYFVLSYPIGYSGQVVMMSLSCNEHSCIRLSKS